MLRWRYMLIDLNNYALYSLFSFFSNEIKYIIIIIILCLNQISASLKLHCKRLCCSKPLFILSVYEEFLEKMLSLKQQFLKPFNSLWGTNLNYNFFGWKSCPLICCQIKFAVCIGMGQGWTSMFGPLTFDVIDVQPDTCKGTIFVLNTKLYVCIALD